MLHLLIAPNAFKHSLDARQVAEALGEGFSQSRLDCRTTLFPIGDGGDGTCKLLHEKLGGMLVTKTVLGPLGTPVEASYSLVEGGKTAIIEMADASGIRLIKEEERNPLQASSKGTGQLILHALEHHKVNQIILGMGGSATVDGGCGMLHALGVRFFDKKGKELDPIPEQLQYLERIDTSGLDKSIVDSDIKILCDVENRLLGEEGAANVFGPQKGASQEQVKVLDNFLHRLSDIVLQTTGKNMADIVSGGTAGGAAAGMYALADAQLVNGIAYFLQKTGFEDVIKKANWLITGEGSLDEQTLSGKAPAGVALLAKKYAIPTVGIAGRVPLEPSSALLEMFDVLLPISHEAMPLAEALANTEQNLRRTAEALGNILACNNKNN
ncbi:glycerate kinase family protein [Sphingobacterium chuzhouense]|uniref:Glycerate kinase n=1 Tax=Sphingobacterium chuzhouense TaxID=1742264 RepID=A0ABR7XPI8_9SPHI|nr:glycerate kinase [Sphingobacterium chuzhouense]MBD1421093.1 glycerate kinase [Sphingobacterium chuzhouense]